MKPAYKEFYELLHHETSFGWDLISNTVQGLEIVSRSKASLESIYKLRVKGNRNMFL